MKRMVTKQSTITPMSTAKGKSMGSGVSNMGKGKSKGKSAKMGYKIPLDEARKNNTKAPKEGFFNKAYKEAANEGMQTSAQTMSKKDKKNMAMQMAIGAAAGAGMPRIAMERTVTKKTTKAKAKMLPTVTVTAKKPMLQLARKAKKIK